MKRIVSGIQPTGGIHLGNYLGAIKNWVSLQTRDMESLEEERECFFFLADLHAITAGPNPRLKSQVLDMTAMLMACGIGGRNTTLFSQQMIPEHTELQWLLTCTARMGWLNRMTQFKDKGGNDTEEAFRAGFQAGYAYADTQGFEPGEHSAWEQYENQQRNSIGVGLFSYPILQAADVLLYDATDVPVGDDQRQHLQLARDIADKFNYDYGVEIFKKPMTCSSGPTTRVMSLKNGSKKMSKSDPDDMTRINLTDTPEEIIKKYRRATTDTLMLPSSIEGLRGRLEVSNLVCIYAAITDQSVETVVRELAGQGHGVLKQRLADATIALLEPISRTYKELRSDEDMLWNTLHQGAMTATIVAGKKMDAVRKAIFGYM